MDLTGDQYTSLTHGEATEGFEIIEESDWIDDGKYSYKDVVFKFDDKFYVIYPSRSGSYFSDYFYDYEDLVEFKSFEVEKVEVTTHKWKIIKK